MNTQHSFNIKVAKLLGIEKAILLQYIDFWLEKNEANGMGIYNNEVYMYHTIDAFYQIFNYISKSSIGRFLRELETDEYIKSSQNFESNKRNRVKYYTLTKKYYEILESEIKIKEKPTKPDTNEVSLMMPKWEMHDTKMENATFQNGKCINDISNINNNIITSKVIKKVIKNKKEKYQKEKNTNTLFENQNLQEHTPPQYQGKNMPNNPLIDDYQTSFMLLWNIYPRKNAKAQALKAYKKIHKDYPRIKQSIEKHIQTQWKDNIARGELQFIPHFATFLNQKRYLDELETKVAKTLSINAKGLQMRELITQAQEMERANAQKEHRAFDYQNAREIYLKLKAKAQQNQAEFC